MLLVVGMRQVGVSLRPRTRVGYRSIVSFEPLRAAGGGRIGGEGVVGLVIYLSS